MADIITRVILQPRGGGEPLETFDSPEPPEVEADTLLAVYKARFGEPIDVAYTQLPDLGEVQIGCVFHVPEPMVLPGPHEEFEMLLVPMVDDPAVENSVSLFLQLAEHRRQFEELFDAGKFDEFRQVTLKQRNPGEQPVSELKIQRRARD